MSLIIAQVWRKRSKRWCAQPNDYTELYRNRSRRSMSIAVNGLMPLFEPRAIAKLKVFLIDNYQNENAKIKVREFYKNITYMQKRIRDQFLKKDAKAEILVNYWDKLFGLLQIRASELNDKCGKDLCRNLIVVPKEVRWAVLRSYVDRCQELNAIAFL